MEKGLGILIMTMVFITSLGFLLNEAGISEYSLISPTIFLVGQALMLLAIGLTNTPIAKGGALLLWVGWLFGYCLNLSIPDPVGTYVYALILVPSFVSITILMLEVGKG